MRRLVSLSHVFRIVPRPKYPQDSRNKRLAQFTQEAADQQAGQNREMSQSNCEGAEAITVCVHRVQLLPPRANPGNPD